MSTHEELLDAAEQAVEALVADTSVPKTQTKEELENIRDDLDGHIDELEDEINKEESGRRGRRYWEGDEEKIRRRRRTS